MRESHQEFVKQMLYFGLPSGVGMGVYAHAMKPGLVDGIWREAGDLVVTVGTPVGLLAVGAACVYVVHHRGRVEIGEWTRRRVRLARYRARWGALVAKHGLAVVKADVRLRPSILGLEMRPPHTDVLTVEMLDGQSLKDFHHRRGALAAGLGVAAVEVWQLADPARVALVLLLTAATSRAAVGPSDWPPAPRAAWANSMAHTRSRHQTGMPAAQQDDERPTQDGPGRQGGVA